MSEPEKAIELNLGGNEYELRRDNSELYMYFGKLAMFNHVFIQQESTEELRTGLFVPEQYIGKDTFSMLAATMIDFNFPARLNQIEVAEGDAEIITRILAGSDIQDINDSFPDWYPEV